LRPPRSRFVVIIPAHDEAGLIGATVASILANDYPDVLRDVVVVADNCTDDTAARARLAGATCFERVDADRRGKPWALNWILARLDVSRYDGVAIVDADTIVDTGFLRGMDQRLQRGARAIQGYYGVLNPDDNWLTRLAGLPAALNNHFLYPGKQALGLSCSLSGNGMCFEAALLERLGWNAFTLSEDWEYYLILALHDVRVTSAPEAVIYGQVARSLELSREQRIRWSKGRMQACALHWRPLVRKAFAEGTIRPLDALFDIARPTHAILLVLSVGYLLATLLLWTTGAIASAAPGLALAIVAAQAVYFLAGFAIGRPPLRAWLALGAVPWYLAWKSLVTLRAVTSLRERTWVKTTRN
ncbi:MAG TPA: glycosyltransferase family 2 protein, partial [Vicinamibacterales bacterium]|nr:glycosyltransferase family 2 protein [Vicinamibacterales bacterium]